MNQLMLINAGAEGEVALRERQRHLRPEPLTGAADRSRYHGGWMVAGLARFMAAILAPLA